LITVTIVKSYFELQVAMPFQQLYLILFHLFNLFKMIVLTTAATIQIGPTILLFYTVMISNLVFFFAQWEQYLSSFTL
jgi:hypothetical protein